MSDFRDACHEVMVLHSTPDSEVRARHPKGMTARDVLDEVRLLKGADAFPLCTWLDAHDELTALYGEAPRRANA